MYLHDVINIVNRNVLSCKHVSIIYVLYVLLICAPTQQTELLYTVIVVLNLGSKKGTHFWDQKGHFLSRYLIMRAPNFAAPRPCSAQ